MEGEGDGAGRGVAWDVAAGMGRPTRWAGMSWKTEWNYQSCGGSGHKTCSVIGGVSVGVGGEVGGVPCWSRRSNEHVPLMAEALSLVGKRGSCEGAESRWRVPRRRQTYESALHASLDCPERSNKIFVELWFLLMYLLSDVRIRESNGRGRRSSDWWH